MSEKQQPLTQQIWERARSGYAILWIATVEPDRLEESLVKTAPNKWSVLRWDCVGGTTAPEPVGEDPHDVRFIRQVNEETNPIELIRNIMQVKPQDGSSCLVVAHLFHRFLQRDSQVGNFLVQAIRNTMPILKSQGIVLVIPAPSHEGLPRELEKDIELLDHEYPDDETLRQIAEQFNEIEGVEPPDQNSLARIVTAASGLTYQEAENAMALSIHRHHRIDPNVMMQQKHQTVKKSGVLEIANFPYGFDDVGGLEQAKHLLDLIMGSKTARRKGCLLVGMPGVGKSLLSKAAGREFGLPTVLFDIARCFGGIVGETEGNIRNALKTIRAIGRCIVFLDEISSRKNRVNCWNTLRALETTA